MEKREWAISILSADTIAGKLAHPEILTDEHPGPPLIWDEPVRPAGMSFCKRSKEDKLPSFQEHDDLQKRVVCLHRFAGHELLAVEIMAFTLLAFPEAPKTFRRGLAHTLKEEQEHVRLYVKRMDELNMQFGDLPLYKHFWKHTPYIKSPMDYVCMMSLTFEMANLDFAPMYGNSFARHGDMGSAQLMARILQDEINHVGFGWNWLKRFRNPEGSEWDAWEQTLSSTLLTPKRAKGFQVNEAPRQQAGIPQEWIDKIKKL
jgi:uncharacterized ferritin-like protein (DUF455 family)